MNPNQAKIDSLKKAIIVIDAKLKEQQCSETTKKVLKNLRERHVRSIEIMQKG